MKTFWVIALVGFVAVSFFGLLSIHHQGDHIAECLASRLNGSDAPCPEADPFGFANFHNDALKKISNLIIIDSAAVFYLMALYTFLTFWAISLLDFNGLSLSRIRFSKLELLALSYPLQAIRLSWFSLHENSPSFL